MRTLNIALTFLFNIFFCMSLLAYDFDDLLSVNHTFENYYLKPVKKQSRAIASTPSLQKEEKNLSPFLDQGVNLDVNGNGKDDTWRTIKLGRVVSSKSDLNEDGKIDIRVEYDQFGQEKKFLRDTNYDGRFDYKKKCENQKCITLVDNNNNGEFETKIVENFKTKKKNIFSFRSKKWALITSLDIELTGAQSEGAHVECDGNCETAVSPGFAIDFKELRDKISEKYLNEAPPKIQISEKSYFQATSKYGVLVHSSCFASGKVAIGNNKNIDIDVPYEVFKDKVDKAIEDFVSCAGKLKKFSEDRGETDRYANFANNIYLKFANLLNPIRPAALKPKIACVDMKSENSTENIASGSVYMQNTSWDASVDSEEVLGTIMGPPYVTFKNKDKFLKRNVAGRFSASIETTVIHEMCHNLGYSHDDLPDFCNVVDGLMDACYESKNFKDLTHSEKFLSAYNQVTMKAFDAFSNLESYDYLVSLNKKSNKFYWDSDEGVDGIKMFFANHRVLAPNNYFNRIKYLTRLVEERVLDNDEVVDVVGSNDPLIEGTGMAEAVRALLEESGPERLDTDLQRLYYYIFRDKALDTGKREVSSLVNKIIYNMGLSNRSKTNLGKSDSDNENMDLASRKKYLIQGLLDNF